MGGLGLPAADGGLGNSTSGYDEDQTMMNTRARVKMEPGQEQGGFPEGAEGDVGEHNGNRVVGYEELAMMMAHSHGSGMKNDEYVFSFFPSISTVII